MPGGGGREALVADVVQRSGRVAFLCGVTSCEGRGRARSSQPYLGPRGCGCCPGDMMIDRVSPACGDAAAQSNHTLTIGSGRAVTAVKAVRMIPAHAWHRMRTGSGTKGTRHYDWAMLEVASDDTPGGHGGGHSVLLARRHRYTGTLSFCRCWTPGPVPLSRLIAIAVIRWQIAGS